ncbi:MAG: ATP-dependent zinc metalloprotease FtsH, partial [Spiroplasma sp.]|nr:ATP-dependent zinc metalloprotease FtsH [Mycoplasmatales bacterium]
MNKKQNPILKIIIITIFAVAIFSLFSIASENYGTDQSDSMPIQEAIEQDLVESISITPKNEVYIIEAKLITPAGSRPSLLSENILTQAAVAELEQQAILKEIPIIVNEEPQPSAIGGYLVTILMFGAIIFFMSRLMGGKNSPMSAGENKARLSKNSKIRFSDVIGYEEEKQELVEIIDFLKNPSLYREMGANVPNGVLLEGPPGTGKTLMAKAVAGEASVPFFSISGSDFIEMFVGVGASRVRNLFKEAKKNGPCIVFIDEIDAIGSRDSGAPGGRNTEQEQTINALLVELDGFATDHNKGHIIIIGATNRADKLDPALLRPGRFDRKIMMGLPVVQAREDILKYHGSKRKISKAVDYKEVAKNTSGMSGAQLEAVINESAILAVRSKFKEITYDNMAEAVDRVLMGPAKISNKYSEQDKKVVAYHESGHAITGLELKEGMQVQKITIIPRRNAGGYVSYSDNDDIRFITKTRLDAMLITLMAGRASEEIFIGDITTGAQNDFERASNIARGMVTKFGMTSLGKYQYEPDDPNAIYRTKQYSDKSAEAIDAKVNEILDNAYKEALKILKKRKDDVHLLAKTIQEVETLGRDEIDYLIENGKLKKAKKVKTFSD